MKLIEKMNKAFSGPRLKSYDMQAAAKAMLDDMREWADKNVTEKEFFKALLDAYEKDRMND